MLKNIVVVKKEQATVYLPVGKSPGYGWLVGTLLLIFAVHSFSLLRLPAPFVDEAWLASRAWGIIQTGRNFGILDSGVFDRLNGYWTFFPWISTHLYALMLSFAPVPSFFVMRLVSLWFGMILLSAVYVIGKHFTDRWGGLLSVVLVAISPTFFLSAHLARMDIIAATLGFTGIALYCSNRKGHFGRGVLTGLLVGLAFEVHAHAAIYTPVLLGLYLWDYRQTLLRQRHWWGMVTGGTIAGLFYAWAHLLQYPQSFMEFNRLAFFSTHTPPLLTGNINIIGQSLLETLAIAVREHQVALPAVIFFIAEVFRKRQVSYYRFLWLYLGLMLFSALLVRNKIAYYFILWMPVLEIILALALRTVLNTTLLKTIPHLAARLALWSVATIVVIAHLPMIWGLTLGGMWILWVVIKYGIHEGQSLVVYGGLLLVLSLIMARFSGWYWVLLIAPLDLIVSALIPLIFKNQWITQLRPYVTLLLVGCWTIAWVSLTATSMIKQMQTNLYQDYEHVQSQLNQLVKPGERIMGSQTFWFGFYEHPYYSWEQMIYYQRYVPQSSLEEAFKVFHPDLFIVDDHLEKYISDCKGSELYDQYLCLPRAEIDQILATYGDLIATLNDGMDTYVKVYRLHWGALPTTSP